MKSFIDKIEDPCWSNEEKIVLKKMCSLYGSSCLERWLGDLYSGNFVDSTLKIDQFLREGIIKLSKELVNEAVSLVDILSPPDFILNSPLGMSDGEV